ncbi:MAG: tRNA threonylcarbamoyladenosine dehydratase [Phascolarctobacterium sp.]|nr:tRNA threonylcarbamoyladenosine dehydratase [Phascolarctobacterium sp.]
MLNQFSRTALLVGTQAIDKLEASRVAIFGIGGVGGYVAEALARSGVGSFDLIDNDTVALTNLNRQIIATHATLGQPKVQVMAERIHAINPEAHVYVHQCFFLPENAHEFDFSQYDYVVDAVDTVAAKITIIMAAKAAGVPVISSMGAGNKMNPGKFQVADIFKTSVDPLARVMRQEMKKRGVKKLKVVYSTELPLTPVDELEGECHEEAPQRRALPGSTAFTPSAAGLLLASEVVKDLIGWDGGRRKGVAQ